MERDKEGNIKVEPEFREKIMEEIKIVKEEAGRRLKEFIASQGEFDEKTRMDNYISEYVRINTALKFDPELHGREFDIYQEMDSALQGMLFMLFMDERGYEREEVTLMNGMPKFKWIDKNHKPDIRLL